MSGCARRNSNKKKKLLFDRIRMWNRVGNNFCAIQISDTKHWIVSHFHYLVHSFSFCFSFIVSTILFLHDICHFFSTTIYSLCSLVRPPTQMWKLKNRFVCRTDVQALSKHKTFYIHFKFHWDWISAFVRLVSDTRNGSTFIRYAFQMNFDDDFYKKENFAFFLLSLYSQKIST